MSNHEEHGPRHLEMTVLMTPDMVNFSGKVLGIRVDSENHRTGDARHVMSCFFVMVAMGDDGTPAKVPRFEPSGETERRRWQDAERRHAIRRGADG
ncbi:MAG: hypothetical protein ACQEVA_11660 [Myxococcota bacterium]